MHYTTCISPCTCITYKYTHLGGGQPDYMYLALLCITRPGVGQSCHRLRGQVSCGPTSISACSNCKFYIRIYCVKIYGINKTRQERRVQIGGHVGVEACVQEIRRGKRVCVNVCRTYHCTRSKQPAEDGWSCWYLVINESI